jgi:non-heme chloroperoxidase
VPTLVIQGDDDQIVPIGASGLMSSKIQGRYVANLSGCAHGLCSTLKDQVNADLLAFIRT